jgi:hypothetical protein
MLRAVQAIVTHLERFPPERAEAACRRASHFGTFSYQGVKNILVRALDLSRQPLLDGRLQPLERRQVGDGADQHPGRLELATCAFVERHDNVLIVGPTGVGKSHLAQALGHRACRAGFTVAYVGAHELLVQLRAARGDGSYEKRLLRFTTPDVLIVDDLGLRGLAQDEPADLYEIVRRRYEHGTTIITSNRAIEEWPPMFGNPLLASAAMDRLLHHAHVLVIEGDSYRNPPPTRRKKTQPEATR